MRETEIDALIELGLLRNDDRQDRNAILSAVYPSRCSASLPRWRRGAPENWRKLGRLLRRRSRPLFDG
jgi:hypothetical protein